jgi:hypothetical protein
VFYFICHKINYYIINLNPKGIVSKTKKQNGKGKGKHDVYSFSGRE